jgi:hypothetical protein
LYFENYGSANTEAEPVRKFEITGFQIYCRLNIRQQGKILIKKPAM